MKERLNKILVDLGYSETEDLLWTKTIEQKSPDQTIIINGQRTVQPGQTFKVTLTVSAFIDNYWIDNEGNAIEPGFYLIEIGVRGPQGYQKSGYEMFNIDELDKLSTILKQ